MIILDIIDLKKSFGAVKAVDNINLKVRKGEILTIIGPNGAGKTTLANLITGYLYPDHGKIYFNNIDITRYSLERRIKIGIARSFQLANLFSNLTILENVLISLLSKAGRSGKLRSLIHSHRDLYDEAFEILKMFRLENRLDELPINISQGERKLLDVAIAIALRPKLIILDEPTSGVATKDKDLVINIIRSSVKNMGITAIVIEHDMDIVFRYSDRILVMHQGRAIALGKPEDIRRRDDLKTLLLGDIYA